MVEFYSEKNQKSNMQTTFQSWSAYDMQSFTLPQACLPELIFYFFF